MTNREKEWRMEQQQFEYLKNEKSFLDGIKSIFQFLYGYHLVKKKWIQALRLHFGLMSYSVCEQNRVRF